MQINDILILADNNFTSIKKTAIQIAKIITKNKKYFILAQPLKFNRAQIKLDSNSIILIKKNHVNGIFLLINHNTNSISSKRIIRKKLSTKEQYLAQRIKNTYITSVY